MISMKSEWNMLGDPVLNNLPGGIIVYEVTSVEINFLYINEKTYKVLGYEKKDVIKEHDLELKDCVAEWELERVVQEVTTSQDEEQFVTWFQGKRKDGSTPWYTLHSEKIKSVSEKKLFMAILIDVTQTKEEESAAKRMTERARCLYECDSLTALYRKEIFEKKVTERLKEDSKNDYVIVKWDIEHFKLINELFGYETGNQLLVQVGRLLHRCAGNKGVTGRVGADQFVVCMPLERLNMKRIYQRLKQIIHKMKLDYKVKIYAGIYIITDKEEQVSFMCDKASIALANIKGNMKSYEYYNSDMMDNMLHEQEIKNEMQDALNNDQFKVYVQPKYDIATGKIIGGEALVRWHHPEKGFVSPDEFIPYFEKNGFISHMDQYVWKNVAVYLENCAKENKRLLPISVNASRVDFYKDNLYEHFTDLLKKYNIASKYLELEVTESAYVGDEKIIYSTLEKLQKAGITILIDDFGSGYSSFCMMKQAPIDVLKLDMEFLRGLEGNERGKKIVKHMVELAQDLMVPVIAEGVETEEHVKLLKEVGCDYAQGYYYSKPVPLEEYDKMIQR